MDDDFEYGMRREIDAHKAKIEQELANWGNPLKNGKKGEAYQCYFQLPECVVRPKFRPMPDLGLKLAQHPKNNRMFFLHGTPTRAGNFTLVFDFLGAGYRNEVIRKVYYGQKKMAQLAQSHKLNLVINPDPRDLWKDIPANRDLPYYKPDRASKRIFDVNNELLAASQRGRSHAHSGLPRDDDFALGLLDDWQILVVADGAGSAKFSRHGSAIACEAALRVCRESSAVFRELDRMLASVRAASLPEAVQKAVKMKLYDILPRVVAEARKELRNEAARKQCEMRDYATTLLMAIVKKFPAGYAVGSFQIGDGAMAMIYDRTQVKLLSEPDEGEFGGQTRFITMKDTLDSPEDLMRRVHIDFVEDLNGVLLMTDGVSDAKFETLANLHKSELWLDIWKQMAELAKGRDAEADLLEWLQFWSQGNHDDRTIAMLKIGPVLQLSMRHASCVPAVQESF